MSLHTPLVSTPSTAPSKRVRVDQVIASSINLATLTQNLELLAEAEGGIVRLRQLVLGLALKGGLSGNCHGVERRPSNENLPPDWQVKPIGEIADCVLGKMLDKSKHRSGTQRPYLRNINVRWGSVDLTDLLEMFFEDDELERYGVKRGDVLICEGGEPGRAAVWNGPEGMLIQKAIHRVRPHKGVIMPEWIVVSLRHDSWAGRLDGLFTGATIKHFTGQVLRAYAIPVPPLAEQKRIVARVDQLMALIDDLEAKQTKKRALSTRFTKAALESLTTAESREDFDTAWQRVLANFPTVVDRSDTVESVRESILALAFAGALVPCESDSKDQVAELLRLTSEERAGLVSSGAIDKTQLPKMDEAEYRFPLPAGWQLPRLDDVAYVVDPNPSHRNPLYTAKGFPFISTQEFVGREGLILETPRRVAEQTVVEQESRCRLSPRSILFSRKGTIGKTRIFPGGCRVGLLDSLCVVNPFKAIHVRYLNYALRSPQVRRQTHDMTRGLALPQISVGRVRLLRIPIASEAEQERIVARIDQLMKLCDDLEAKLRCAEDRASKLVEAVVQEIVA